MSNMEVKFLFFFFFKLVNFWVENMQMDRFLANTAFRKSSPKMLISHGLSLARPWRPRWSGPGKFKDGKLPDAKDEESVFC